MSEHLPATIWATYLDDALDSVERATVERHLNDCPVCRADLEAHLALRRRLRRLAEGAAPYTGADVTERGWAAVRPRLGRRWTALLQPGIRLAYGLVATAVLALLVLGLWALFVQQAGPIQSDLQAPAIGPQPESAIQVTEPFTLTLNQSISYAGASSEVPRNLVPVLVTIELHNSGPGTAANVRVTDTIPALLTYLQGSVSGDAIYHPEANAITWAGSLGPGQTHTLGFVCGVPTSVSWPGEIATNQVVVDDGVHAKSTRSLEVNFTPWPTIVPTAGPAPTRTPWATPTPQSTLAPSAPLAITSTPSPETLPPTPTPWFPPTPDSPPTATPATGLTQPPSPTPTAWVPPTPGSPSPTPTPWVTPTPGSLAPVTPTPPPAPPTTEPTQPSLTPTPWVPPPPTPAPGGPPTATPLPPPTVTPVATPTIRGEPGQTPSSAPPATATTGPTPPPPPTPTPGSAPTATPRLPPPTPTP